MVKRTDAVTSVEGHIFEETLAPHEDVVTVRESSPVYEFPWLTKKYPNTAVAVSFLEDSGASALCSGERKWIVPSLYPSIPHLDWHSIILCAKLTYDVSVGTLHEYTTTSVNMEEHGGGGTHNLHISIIVYYFTPCFAAAYEPGYSPGGSVDEHPHDNDATIDIHLSDAEFRE